MARYALVNAEGVAENVIEWDGASDWSPPEGLTAVEAAPEVSPGWALVGEAWQAPAGEAL